jgi:hypothetical protein
MDVRPHDKKPRQRGKIPSEERKEAVMLPSLPGKDLLAPSFLVIAAVEQLG